MLHSLCRADERRSTRNRFFNHHYSIPRDLQHPPLCPYLLCFLTACHTCSGIICSLRAIEILFFITVRVLLFSEPLCSDWAPRSRHSPFLLCSVFPPTYTVLLSPSFSCLGVSNAILSDFCDCKLQNLVMGLYLFSFSLKQRFPAFRHTKKFRSPPWRRIFFNLRNTSPPFFC